MENFAAVGERKEGGWLSPKIIQEIPTFFITNWQAQDILGILSNASLK